MSGEAVTQENPSTRIATQPVPVVPWRVKAITALPDYRLAVIFMDGTSGLADCSAILATAAPGAYAPLRDPGFFSRVWLELGVPTWPNGIDIDPAWLYDSLSDEKTWSVPF